VTIIAPPTFGVTVVCAVMPPLRREQWRKIGGIANPRQQSRNHRVTNGLFCNSVLITTMNISTWTSDMGQREYLKIKI
jgi:hypothetical protein